MARLTCDFGPCPSVCNLICSLNSPEISGFLTANPQVYKKAMEGIAEGRKLLEDGLRGIIVELFDADENSNEPLISISFKTCLSENVALQKIAIFDETWWLDNMADVKDKLAFAIEVNVPEYVLH